MGKYNNKNIKKKKKDKKQQMYLTNIKQLNSIRNYQMASFINDPIIL